MALVVNSVVSMASLRRSPNSKFWIACFTRSDGVRTQRSTKIPLAGIPAPKFEDLQAWLGKLFGSNVSINADRGNALDARDAKRLAQRIADSFEDASREARARGLAEVQARKVIGDVYRLVNDQPLPSSTIRDFFASWLKRKEVESNARTHERYQTGIAHLMEFLGGRAERDLLNLTAKELVALRDHLSIKLSPNSANFTIKVIRAALNQARRDGLVDTNEASRVSLLQRTKTFERRPFTIEEVKVLLSRANTEWKGMILMGLYTGLRLGDIATLQRKNVQLDAAELTLKTEKTGNSLNSLHDTDPKFIKKLKQKFVSWPRRDALQKRFADDGKRILKDLGTGKGAGFDSYGKFHPDRIENKIALALHFYMLTNRDAAVEAFAAHPTNVPDWAKLLATAPRFSVETSQRWIACGMEILKAIYPEGLGDYYPIIRRKHLSHERDNIKKAFMSILGVR